MSWLVAVIEGLLRAILPFLAERLRRSAEESARQPELRARLKDRIRATWSAEAGETP